VDDATMMMIADTIDNAWTYILFFASLVGCVILVVVLVFFVRMAIDHSIRSIRQWFAEGRI
jgi:hypothetical protein